jgi:hypothetical protein
VRAESKNKRKKGRITESKDRKTEIKKVDRGKERKEGGSKATTARLPGVISLG